MVFIAGVDEAGRGPVIGPMVMTIAAIDEKKDSWLKEAGVDDSKALTPGQRENLAEIIENNCELVSITLTNKNIDEALNHPTRNLNILEAETTGKLIDALAKKLGAENIKHVILDCPEKNTDKYILLVQKYMKNKIKLIAEHKADALYPTVSAASIIAKTMRDADIEKIKKKHNVQFGSGYPGDAMTARFVQEHHANKDYDFFRTTWATYKTAKQRAGQLGLGSFSADALSPSLQKKKDKLLSLAGFAQVETKGTSELLRIKTDGATITLYSTGKILVQGKDKEHWEKKV